METSFKDKLVMDDVGRADQNVGESKKKTVKEILEPYVKPIVDVFIDKLTDYEKNYILCTTMPIEQLEKLVEGAGE